MFQEASLSTAEERRLQESHKRTGHWKRWGPYLSERQWGTVREDYSPNSDTWGYFTHEQARSRAYRWGEDGLLGFCDRQCRLCFALALWNGRDRILKERLFGVTGPEGNHGEDVKEYYYYLDSSPTHSYAKGLYKYPQGAFPYERLLDENRHRSRLQPEFELLETGLFEDNRYFDVQVEYAKAAPDDILIRITVSNRGPDAATLHVLPTLWFRNTWSWGCSHDGCERKPRLSLQADHSVLAQHASLDDMHWLLDVGPDGKRPAMLFTDNETNNALLFGGSNASPYVKDSFHDRVIQDREDSVRPEGYGTKAAAWYVLHLEPGATAELRMRLTDQRDGLAAPFGRSFQALIEKRLRETDEFYATRLSPRLSEEQSRVARQAYAGLLWTKQFYHYSIKDWLQGDPAQPAPPESRKSSRNHDWGHLFNRDIISMPDKWEYPWYAAWDLAFHMLPFARVDADFAREQLILFLREWYMHPNGQIPAYEFNFGDVNPPVHAWACWRVYKMTGARGHRDRQFLARCFHKLVINFTWWVNRKDLHGRHLFSGGFLGLDNIGVFDRSRPLPTGGHLEQADGTAWMAFYCATMLAMALELASGDPAYEDVASKFFEHFVAIVDAMNCLGGTGLWDEQDGFYYDMLHTSSGNQPLRIRSMVGLIPLFAVEVLDDAVIDHLPGFKARMEWFLNHRPDLARQISCMEHDHGDGPARTRRLLAIPSRERLIRVVQYLLDENEFLSPYGVRALSKVHQQWPYVFAADGERHEVRYEPGESSSWMFGGNSNWRGPVWMPVNYLLIEALERYHHFYGDSLTVECPTGSGVRVTLREAAREISRRLTALFLPDESGRRPCHGDERRYAQNPHWRELVLFHEYFHGDTGQGLGASHQTGWTALITRLLEDV